MIVWFNFFSVSPRGKIGMGRDNVDFGRLMSLDYQREWLEQRERKQQLHKEKLKVGWNLHYVTIFWPGGGEELPQLQ